jgi:hypothetical protein
LKSECRVQNAECSKERQEDATPPAFPSAFCIERFGERQEERVPVGAFARMRVRQLLPLLLTAIFQLWHESFKKPERIWKKWENRS